MRNKEPGMRKKEPGMRNKEPGMRKKEPGMRNKEPGLLNKKPGAGAALPDGADTERLDDKNRVQSTERARSRAPWRVSRRAGWGCTPPLVGPAVRLEVG